MAAYRRYSKQIMLAISLMRMGAKGKPYYRVVVKEKRSKRDGKYLEQLERIDVDRAARHGREDIDEIRGRHANSSAGEQAETP